MSIQTPARAETAPASAETAPPLEHPWLIVARREVMSKLTDRTFLISTAVMIAVISGIMGLQAFLEKRVTTYTVAATSAAAPMVQQAKAAAKDIDAKVLIDVVPVADDAAAKAAVLDGSADVWLHQGQDGWVLTGQSGVEAGVRQVMSETVKTQMLAQNATAAGTSVEALSAGSTLRTDQLEGDAAKTDFGNLLGYALAFLFYIASIMFGMALAGSVVEEKSSRIVEIITTKIPVRHLLVGKILGNTVLAVGQMVLFAAVGLIGLSFTPYASFLPGASGAVGWFLAFFLIGFLLIACLWAVAGALASRTEDLQQSSMPVTMLVLGMFLGSFFFKGTALTIASFVPPLSAILMPMRLASGTASWWEPIIAILLLLAAAALIVRFAERLYRRSLLQTQGRISLKQAWSAPE